MADVFEGVLHDGNNSMDSLVDHTVSIGDERLYKYHSRNDSLNESLHFNTSKGNSDYSSGYYCLLCQPNQILALALSSIAISLNVLSLIAISQIKNRITTHLRLIISLCMSDMLIGVSVCMSILTTALIPYNEDNAESSRLCAMCFYMFTKALNSTGLNISLLNLTLMAVDHFMAIIWPLKYPLQMSTSRSTMIIAILWSVAILMGFSDFFTGWNTYYTEYKKNYCEAVYLSLYQDEYTVFVTAAFTSVIMMYIYIRIYVKIRRHKTPGETISSEKIQLQRRNSDMRRNQRALVTTLLILGTFLICWMPMSIYQIALIIHLHIDLNSLRDIIHILMVFDRYLYNLILVNAIADPIIYAVRMRDVQLGYRRLFLKCYPFFQKKQKKDLSLQMWDKSITKNTSLSVTASKNNQNSSGESNGSKPFNNNGYAMILNKNETA